MYSVCSVLVEDLHELSSELVRDILELSDYVESGPAEFKYVAYKAEEFFEIIGFFSALSDQLCGIDLHQL